MKKAFLIFILLGLTGCAALSAGWHDDASRNSSASFGQQLRTFVETTTGNHWAGVASGGIGGFVALFIAGLKKKKEQQ